MIHFSAIGVLGKDAEVRDAGSTKVINFSVAINTGYGQTKSTLWIECSKFGDKVAVADFLKKGTKIYLNGEPSLRTWETKEGKQGTSLSIRVQEIELLSTKGQESDLPVEAPTQAALNDLPF